MKNLPNYLTASNLFCGCVAIVLILTSDPYVSESGRWIVLTKPQVIYGSVFILLAAVFDMLDGLAARKLNLYSPMGKYLDSLADVVSFGVAPAMIVYRGLWASFMNKPNALDVNMIWLSFAFLIAVGAAWRLAKYDAYDEGGEFFAGLPVPTVGLFIASIPLMYLLGEPPAFVTSALNSPWFWYLIIFLFTYLMNSKIEFSKSKQFFIPFVGQYFVIALILVVVAMAVFFKFWAIPVLIFLYVFVHLVRWLIKP